MAWTRQKKVRSICLPLLLLVFIAVSNSGVDCMEDKGRSSRSEKNKGKGLSSETELDQASSKMKGLSISEGKGHVSPDREGGRRSLSRGRSISRGGRSVSRSGSRGRSRSGSRSGSRGRSRSGTRSGSRHGSRVSRSGSRRSSSRRSSSHSKIRRQSGSGAGGSGSGAGGSSSANVDSAISPEATETIQWAQSILLKLFKQECLGKAREMSETAKMLINDRIPTMIAGAKAKHAVQGIPASAKSTRISGIQAWSKEAAKIKKRLDSTTTSIQTHMKRVKDITNNIKQSPGMSDKTLDKHLNDLSANATAIDQSLTPCAQAIAEMEAKINQLKAWINEDAERDEAEKAAAAEAKARKESGGGGGSSGKGKGKGKRRD